MTPILSDNALALVARSLPLMERHRESLQRAIGRYMARRAGPDRTSGRGEAAGRAIMAMLINGARGARKLRPDHAARIGGTASPTAEEYSRFGDGLGAAIRDVLGPDASPALLWAWGDAYWTFVRDARRENLPLAA